MRQHLKSKYFWLPFLVILLIIGINIIVYIEQGNLNYEQNNIFAFWYNIMFLNLGQVVILISPILILYTSLSDFYQKLKGSNLQFNLLRQDYKKFFLSNLGISYLKSVFPYFLVSILVLIIGFFLIPNTVINNINTPSIIQFYVLDAFNPYIYLFLIHILWFLFGSLIVNIGMIVLFIVKKFFLVLPFSLILCHFINFGVGLTLMFIASSFSNRNFYNYASNYIFFEGLMIQSNFFNAYFHTLIYFIISLIVMYKLYSTKEKVVLNFD